MEASIEYISKNFKDEFWEDVLSTPYNLVQNKRDTLKQEIVKTSCDIVNVVQEKKNKIFESQNLFQKSLNNISQIQDNINKINQEYANYDLNGLLQESQKKIESKNKFLETYNVESIINTKKFRRVEEFKFIQKQYEKNGDHWKNLAEILYDKHFDSALYKSISSVNLKSGLESEEVQKKLCEILEPIKNMPDKDVYAKFIYMLHSIFLQENLVKTNQNAGNDGYSKEVLDQVISSHENVTQICSNIFEKINQNNGKFISENVIDSYNEIIDFLLEKVLEEQNTIPIDSQDNDQNFYVKRNEKFKRIIDESMLKYKLSQINLLQKSFMLKPKYLCNFYDYLNNLDLSIEDTDSLWDKNYTYISSNQFNFQMNDKQSQIPKEIQEVFIKITISTKDVLNKIISLLEFEYLKESYQAIILAKAKDIGQFVAKLFSEHFEKTNYYSQSENDSTQENHKMEQLQKIWFVNLWK